jgi:hypothetical protein
MNYELEGNGYDVISVLSQHLPEETEINHETSQPENPVACPRFESRIFRLQVLSVISRPTCSMIFRAFKNVIFKRNTEFIYIFLCSELSGILYKGLRSKCK